MYIFGAQVALLAALATGLSRTVSLVQNGMNTICLILDSAAGAANSCVNLGIALSLNVFSALASLEQQILNTFYAHTKSVLVLQLACMLKLQWSTTSP